MGIDLQPATWILIADWAIRLAALFWIPVRSAQCVCPRREAMPRKRLGRTHGRAFGALTAQRGSCAALELHSSRPWRGSIGSGSPGPAIHGRAFGALTAPLTP